MRFKIVPIFGKQRAHHHSHYAGHSACKCEFALRDDHYGLCGVAGSCAVSKSPIKWASSRSLMFIMTPCSYDSHVIRNMHYHMPVMHLCFWEMAQSVRYLNKYATYFVAHNDAIHSEVELQRSITKPNPKLIFQFNLNASKSQYHKFRESYIFTSALRRYIHTQAGAPLQPYGS